MARDHLKGILIGLAIVFTAAIFLYYLQSGSTQQLQEAAQSYEAGEKATTFAERESGFNHALALYNELEKDYQPEFGTGKLYYNLANTYFQMGQYPLAIYNYEKALLLMPREEKVAQNLSVAKAKLGITEEKKESNFDRIFYFHYRFSLPERLQLFFLVSLLVLLISSFYLWYRQHSLKTGLMVSLIFWVIMLCSLGYTRYISPLEGIIVRSTDMYRDAGSQYAKVMDHPILAGSKVEVIDVMPNGKWLKVITEGQMGYVPQESIRLI